MAHYQHLEDFLRDPSFQAWIDGDPEATAFWTAWRRENPEHQAVLDQAKALMYTVRRQPVDLSDDEVRQEVQHLVTQFRQRKQTERPETEPLEPVVWWNRRVWLRGAASILVVLGLGFLLVRQNSRPEPTVYRQLVSEAPTELLEKTNTNREPLTLVLADGSAITLEQNSRISYPKQFTGSFREVYLSGEAFFEVAHNPGKPFLVYANETVTKVLGTSFRIRAFDTGPEVAVAVRTGKVSVYPKTAFRKTTSGTVQEPAGVLLIPNQEVVFNRKTEQLQKGRVEKPELVAIATHVQELDVEDVPVTQVLEKLEKAYGIELVYDKNRLEKCPITAQFSDETLANKLEFICRAIGATYQVQDGRVLIQSPGCTP
ncbi:FecR family protein [Larkinella rosea]|uniref:FecR family protein n=1 Tax=Larkinella rosea TaxID=2025312 RepID=A0A3P1BUH1_9BACT|nr:FecR family protein [Larkinella rosea]RRB04727.1 FecR family protein [Larkinella rosea]